MMIFGVILMLIGIVTGITILWSIGVLILLVGAVRWLLGMMGRAVGGRRHYY